MVDHRWTKTVPRQHTNCFPRSKSEWQARNIVSHPGVIASCCTLSTWFTFCIIQSQTAGQDALFRCCMNIFCVLICVTAAIFPFNFQMMVVWKAASWHATLDEESDALTRTVWTPPLRKRLMLRLHVVQFRRGGLGPDILLRRGHGSGSRWWRASRAPSSFRYSL